MHYLPAASRVDALPAAVRVRVALDVLEQAARSSPSRTSPKRATVAEVTVNPIGYGVIPPMSSKAHLATLVWEVLAAKAADTDETPWGDPASDLPDAILDVMASLSVRPPESVGELLKRFSAAATPIAAPRREVLAAVGASSPTAPSGSVEPPAASRPLPTPLVPRDNGTATIPAPAMTAQALAAMTEEPSSTSKSSPSASRPLVASRAFPVTTKSAGQPPAPKQTVARVALTKSAVPRAIASNAPAPAANGAALPLKTRPSLARQAGLRTPTPTSVSAAPSITVETPRAFIARASVSPFSSADTKRYPPSAVPGALGSESAPPSEPARESATSDSPTSDSPTSDAPTFVATASLDGITSDVAPISFDAMRSPVPRPRESNEPSSHAPVVATIDTRLGPTADESEPAYARAPRRWTWLVVGASLGAAVLLIVWATQGPRGKELFSHIDGALHPKPSMGERRVEGGDRVDTTPRAAAIPIRDVPAEAVPVDATPPHAPPSASAAVVESKPPVPSATQAVARPARARTPRAAHEPQAAPSLDSPPAIDALPAAPPLPVDAAEPVAAPAPEPKPAVPAEN